MEIVGWLRPRRALTVPAVAGAVCLMLAFGSVAPAQAVPGSPARPIRPARMTQSAQSLEWWFSQWDISTRVWPLSRGAGVTVALLDSGVQANLPDIRAAVLPGGNVTGGGGEGWTDTAAPAGHGTGMASLIAGQGTGGGVLGIAPDAKILPVVVLSLSNSEDASDSTVAAGIRYAVAHGAQVINMSLGGPTASPDACDDQQLQDAVAYALQHNVIMVASAGNEGTDGNPPESPASCAGVLAVGSVGPNLKLWSQSERQPYVAVTAPGADAIMLAANGGLGFGSGTSGAAALVSGTAALIRSRYPSMPWYTVVQRIINTALPRGGTVPNESYGYGIVRIPGALNVAKYKVPASAPNPVYAAYQSWLATPQGQQFLAAGRPRPHPASTHSPRTQAAAPASSGGSAGLIALITAAVVVVAGGVALSIAALRRRRRRYT